MQGIHTASAVWNAQDPFTQGFGVKEVSDMITAHNRKVREKDEQQSLQGGGEAPDEMCRGWVGGRLTCATQLAEVGACCTAVVQVNRK